MLDIKNTREIMARRPFKRICPQGYLSGMITDGNTDMYPADNPPLYRIVSQGDFLREYYPTGHRINDPAVYPDITHVVEETNDNGDKVTRVYVELVERCAFAFQRIITIKHLTHLCGNNIQFEATKSEMTEDDYSMFFRYKKGWLTKNMEIAWFEAAKSVKITGDTAFVGYVKDKKFYWKVLSYLSGDTLYPHYDNITGKLALFARAYSDYDENGVSITDWLEVWDDTYMYRLKRAQSGKGSVIARIKEVFGISGYKEVDKKAHGCPFIPVAYHRDEDGACWSPSQDSIESYETAFSRLSQNNAAYAFPIMVFKGDNIELQGDTMRGTVKSITADENADISFLQKQDVSNAFMVQLDRTLKMIYEQSFAVQVPEVKSGDLPGVAIKLLFSPAIENAMKDAQEYNPFVDDMVRIFEWGYGIEIGETTKIKQLKVNAWISPYYHQNASELFNNIAVAIQNGFLSKRTGSERIDETATADEWRRIMRERKEEDAMDLLFEHKKQQQAASLSGDGNGGSVGSSVRTTDENGNHPGENNWEEWNETH